MIESQAWNYVIIQKISYLAICIGLRINTDGKLPL